MAIDVYAAGDNALLGGDGKAVDSRHRPVVHRQDIHMAVAEITAPWPSSTS